MARGWGRGRDGGNGEERVKNKMLIIDVKNC